MNNVVNDFLKLSGEVQTQLKEQNILSTDTVFKNFNKVSNTFQTAMQSNDEDAMKGAYAELQSIHQELKSTSMFDTVTEEATDKIDSPVLRKYHQQALQYGISETVLNDAETKMKTIPSTFDEYIEFVNNSIENKTQANAKIQELVKKQLDQAVMQYGSLENALKVRVLEVYNTSCCASPDIGDYVQKHVQLPEGMNAVFWAYTNINSEVVKAAVTHIKKLWEDNDKVNSYIYDYYVSQGITEDKFVSYTDNIITYLPKHYQEEDSPRQYLALLAIELLLGNDVDNTTGDAIADILFSDSRASLEFMSNYEFNTENNIPIKASETMATTKAAAFLGTLKGKALHFKYDMADSYSNALQNGLGRYADVYAQQQEQIRQRKEQLYQEQMLREQYEANNYPDYQTQQQQQYAQQNPYMQQDPRLYNRPNMSGFNADAEFFNQQPYQQSNYMDYDFQRTQFNQQQGIADGILGGLFHRRKIQNDYGQQYPQQHYQHGYNDRRNVYDRNIYNGNSRYFANQDPHDFSMNVSPKITIILGHLLAMVLLFLIIKWKALACIFGLLIALCGWLKQYSNSPRTFPPMVLIVIGYILAIAPLFIK